MATLQYTVFHNAGATAQGPVLNEGVIAIAGTSTASSDTVDGVTNEARRVRLFADTACFVTWGANPTALNDGSDGRMMAAESWEYVEIQANHKIAVIERV